MEEESGSGVRSVLVEHIKGRCVTKYLSRITIKL